MGFVQWLLGNAVPLQVMLLSVFVGSTLLFVSDSAHLRNFLRVLVWIAAVLNAAFAVTVLVAAPPPPRMLVLFILLVWAVAPPLFFIVEWVSTRHTFLEPSIDFEKFKYSQELGSRLWAALMVLLGLLAQLALR